MGNLRRLAVCWLVLAVLPVAIAQDLEFGFAAGMGSENTEFSHGVAVDGSGNVYMGGYFRGRADFDPGAGTAFLTSGGNADAYLQKLDSSGNLVWIKTISGPENVFGYAVTVDNQGNAYLAGSFSGTADFDPGAGVTPFTAGGSDAFIVKLSSRGALVWARKMGSADTEVALDITVDSSRNVYTSGYFGSTADLDPGAGVVNLVSAGAHDVFVQKLDSSGIFVWARGMGGSADDLGRGIAVDSSGNVYTAGSFEGSGDFNPGAGTTTLTSRGGSDIFVQKLSSAGVLSWAVGMGGSGDDAGYGIGVDKEGNPYTTGYFRGTVDFNPGIASSNAVSNGAQDAFVQRLSTGGVFAWAVAMGGSSTDVGTAIEVNDNGDVHVTGSFTGSVDFEPGTGTTTLASLGVTDVFAQRLDQNGGFVWAKSIGGSAGDEGMAIALDASLGVYLAGTFKASVDFDPSAGTFTIGSNGEADVFVEKLNASGGFVWARGLGGVSSEAGRSVAADGSGNVYATGLFAGVVDFDPGVGVFDVTSAGREDAFVQKLDPNGSLVWALALGGLESDGGLGIAADTAGNVYLTGYFSGTMDLNPGAGVSSATAAGSSDAFVVKLNASGGFVWGYTLGATGADLGTSIAVDSAGAVLVTGTYNGTVDLDPGAATQSVTSKGSSDLFVQKLSSGKSLLWADGLGGVAIELATHIGVDASDNVYLAGSFQGTVDFSPGSGTTNLTSGGATDAYIVKLNDDGLLTWARKMGSNLNEVAYGADVDGSGNVYVVGSFQGTPDFDPGAGVVNATSAGGSDIYLQKFDASGAFLWVRTMGGTATDTGYDVAVDAAGNPYTIGAFRSTASFDGGAQQRTSLGVSDIFLQSMDSAGGFNWVNAYGNGGVDEGRGIATSPSDSVITTGIFSITVDFDPGAGVVSLASAGNSTDIFVYQSEQDLVPTVTSIVPATTGPTNADALGFTVTFSEPVLEFNALADLVLAHSGTAHTGASVSGGPVVYSVSVTGVSGNGSFTLAVSTATGIADSSGNLLDSSITSSPVVIDNAAPTLSIGSPTPSLTNDGPVNFPVTYSGANSVNLTAGAITLNATGTATGTVSVSNGTTSTPTVAIGSITGNGTLGISIGTGTASDAAGNTAAGAGPSATFTVDNTAPTLSIGTPSTSLTKGGPVTYAVTYSGANFVNLTSGAVSLDTTGTATGTVSVSNGTTSTPTVTISGISGNGSIGISIGGGTASDAAGNTASAAGPSATFTVDNTAPTLSIGAPDASRTTGGPVSFLVTYAGEDSVNLTPGAISLNATGTATGMVSVTDGSSSTPTVTISNITGDGVLGISIESGTATDTAGNDAPGAGPSATFAVDNNEPTLSIGAPDVSLTAVGPVSYIVTYDGADSINLTPGAITLNTTGTATGTVSVANGSTSTPTVTISDITGDGTLGISIDSGTAQDSVGNLVPAAGPAATFTVDNTAPVVTIAAPSASLTASGPVNYPVTVSGADTVNLTAGAIALNTTGTASASILVADGTTSTPTVTLDNVTGDGTLAISIAAAIATDLAGNASVAVGPGLAVAVDNTPPVLIIGAPTSALTSGGPVSFPLTYRGADTVDLLPESVSLHVTGSASGTVTVLDASSATPTVTIDAITGDGTLGISIAAGTALDTVGNLSDAAGPSDTFVVDNTDPTGTVDTLATKDGTPALSGTLDDPETTVFVSVGDETLFPAVNNGDSTWSLPDNTIAPALADGLYSVSLALEDPAGNTASVDAGEVLTIDTLAPLVSVDALVTSDATPVLTGAVSDLNEVTVEVSAGGQTLPAAVSNGTWSVQIAEPLADGTYDVTATATDAAGNVAADASTDELLVSTASTRLGFDPLTTSDTTPQLQGTAEDALGVDAVEVTVGGDSYTATLGDGTWTVDISVPLAEGTYDVVLNALNSASTPSTATYSGSLTIDATAPVVTVDTGVVNSATPGLSGTVEDSSEIVSITLTVNGALYAPLVTGNVWALEATDPLPDGVYDVVVSAIDAAGNAGVDITSDELTVDTQAPAPVELILNDASPTREARIGFTLTFDGPVTGVDRGDFLLVVDGVPQEPSIPDSKAIGATPLSLDVAGEGMQYVLTVSTGTGDGGIAILLENDGTILDHAGNALVAGLEPSEAYTLDRTPPQASISTTVTSPTSQAAIPIVITFDESVTGFLLEDLAVENGVAADLLGDGLTYAATLVPASAGEVLVALLPGSVTDGVGNPVGEVQELSIQFSPGGEGEGEGETCVEQCAGEGVDGDGDGLSTCVEDCIGTSDAATDTDNDGIADSYEFRYDLDPLFDDAADDADFDDLSNIAEFLVNSDPTDANSPDSTLFVATDGNDETGNGTESAPWRTISFALDQAALLGGDSTRIVVQTGTYVEDLLLEEGVSITGATDSDVVLQGTIVGAQGSALRSLTVISAEGASHMLEMNDVAMLLLEVDFIGTPARDVTAILVDGNAVPLGSVIDACTFSSVGVGIDIGGEIPAIRRCTFGNIPAQFGEPARPGAGIIIRANSTMESTLGAIGDESDPENAWNDFLNTIEGFAVINERDEAVLMQTNYWGVGQEGEVPARISGPAVFVPVLSQSSAVLAASLFCTVWDDTDQARIKSAGVMLTISPLNEVTNNTDGIYAFPAISENEYTLTIRAPGYAEKSSLVEIRAGELLSLTIPMSAAAVEGEGEGEGETGCNASKYLVSGTASDSAASIFLIGLTVSILLGWGRIDRRI